MIVVIMGAAGAGKSTIGELLARQLGCSFVDADALHPAINIEKMSRGVPLNDVDRAPWLVAIHGRVLDSVQSHYDLLVACSALKERYRQGLALGVRVTWVYLKGSEQLLRERLQRRQHHFMRAEMLASQLEDLEEPETAIVIDAGVLPQDAVAQILHRMSLSGSSGTT